MGGVIPDYDGAWQAIGEAVYSAAVDCVVNQRGRPASALLRPETLMMMAESFGYEPSGRVRWLDGAVALWLPYGFIEIRPDIGLTKGTGLLYDCDGNPLIRIGFAV